MLSLISNNWTLPVRRIIQSVCVFPDLLRSSPDGFLISSFPLLLDEAKYSFKLVAQSRGRSFTEKARETCFSLILLRSLHVYSKCSEPCSRHLETYWDHAWETASDCCKWSATVLANWPQMSWDCWGFPNLVKFFWERIRTLLLPVFQSSLQVMSWESFK